eukprot:8065875-Pyramimonas_sp.AAC.1
MLSKPINVSGDGKKSQLVERSVTAPLRATANDAKCSATHAAPAVGADENPSTVPASWGIMSMRHQRAVIAPVNNDMHLCESGR